MTEEYEDKSRDWHSETKGNRDNAQGTSANRAESSIESGQQSRKSVSEVSEGRRRFTKAGLLASPVLMSVASRPVFGGGTPCMSNILSGNLSNPSRGQCATGAGPSDWLPLADSWSSLTGGLITQATAFNDFFPTNGAYADTTTSLMVEILTQDATSIESSFIAALLNAAASPPPPADPYVLTVLQVTEHLWPGHYVHVVNVQDFLNSTW